MKRTCSCCDKEKPLNKKHFQVVKSFKQGFSFWCLDCNEESKKLKPRKQTQDVKLQTEGLSRVSTTF
jgi:hypothetical protein